jgi:myosin heavy subunit
MVLYIKDKKIIGGCNEEYLLEAIRVTDPNEHERNYHIFYQLLYGGSDEMLAKYKLSREPFDYRYLKASGTKQVPTIDDIEDYKALDAVMTTLNITGDLQDAFWRIMAGILHMGNLEVDGKDFDSSKPCGFKNPEVLDIVAEVLQMDKGMM